MVAFFTPRRKSTRPTPSTGGARNTHPVWARRAVLGLIGATALAACDVPGMATSAGPRIDARGPVQVALIVPSGGGDAGSEAIARSLENAARLAMADLSGVEIDLRVYSDGGDAGRAGTVAAQAAGDGAQIILGPVFAGAATAAGQAVAGRGISVLSFSNNPDAAGGNVFILGQTFASSAQRLMGHAVSQGVGRTLIVHERNSSGEAGQAAIAAAVARSGGAVAGTQGFDFSQQGVVEALPAITEAAREGGAQSIFFTSNTAGALPLLTQLLAENRAGPTVYQYIGLTRWDIPPESLDLRSIQGGWFALPDPDLQAQFTARYRAAHGSAPHPLAWLAYDGMAAIGALVASGNPNALSREALTQAQGFAGVGGVFRLRPDGTNERGLAIATIRDGAVQIVAPAPRSFVGAGS